jgi:hypothetical protein
VEATFKSMNSLISIMLWSFKRKIDSAQKRLWLEVTCIMIKCFLLNLNSPKCQDLELNLELKYSLATETTLIKFKQFKYLQLASWPPQNLQEVDLAVVYRDQSLNFQQVTSNLGTQANFPFYLYEVLSVEEIIILDFEIWNFS